MKTRPWPLVVLAILQILSPVGTILATSWALSVHPAYVIQWIFERPPLQVFETLLLMPIAGIAIYAMRSWSYAVFFAAMAWSLGSNLRQWNYATHHYPIGLAIAMYAFQVGLVIYFIIPAVRRTYLDPRVRWWEAKRRYVLGIPLELESEGKKDASSQVENISEGGALVSSRLPLGRGAKVRAVFTVLAREFAVDGEIMYSVAQPQGTYAFGIKFNHTRESERRFKNLVQGLELIGIHDRDTEMRLPWHVSLLDWAKTLAKSGKGLVPEAQTKRT